MTVTAITSRNTYTGTGAIVPYPYTFRIFAATDLSVIKRNTATGLETTLTYPGDFTVTGVGNANGGTVTLIIALAVGETLAIRRVRPVKQQTSLRNQGAYFPAEVENAIDSGIMIAQQHTDDIGRALKLPASIDPADFDMIIPATLTPGSALVVNAAGTGFSQASLSAAQLAAWNAAQNIREDVFLSGAGFTAGVTTSLTLSAAPGNAANISIVRTTAGVPVVYTSNQYTIVGTTLTFGTAIPASTSRVQVRYLLTYQVNTVDSANATYNADGTGAISRNVRDVLRDHVLITDYGADPFGSAAANTLAIQRAMDAGAATGRRVRMVAGAVPYLITPNVAVTDETGAAFTCFLMRSGMHLDFDPGCTLTIENGVSTAAAPVQMRMFFTNEVLADISFSGGGAATLDMNGANNRISPDAVVGAGTATLVSGVGTFSTSQAGVVAVNKYILIAGGSYQVATFNGTTGFTVYGTPSVAATAFTVGTYTRLNQAHIWVSGTPAGVAARVTGGLVEGMRLINCPGTTSICLQQSNTLGVTLSKNWKLINLDFDNNGFDTDDHSTIFGWADDVLYDGLRMRGVASTFNTSNAVCIEVHGARQRCVNFDFRSYYQGFWIAPNFTSPTDGTIIGVGQMTDMRGTAIDFFRSSANEQPVTNTKISGPTVTLNDLPIAATFKVGVQIVPPYLIDGVQVGDFTVIKTGTNVASCLGSIGTQLVAGQKHTNITFSNKCRSRGTTFGVHLATTATNGLGAIEVTQCEFMDLTPTAIFADAIGLAFTSGASAIDTLTTGGNSTTGGNYGEYLTGTITQLNRQQSDYRTAAVAAISEVALTVGGRAGCFMDHTFTPTIKGGATPITLGNGTLVGAYDIANGKVTMRALLTIGSTTVIPAGTISVSLPFASAGSGMSYLGNYRISDFSATFFYAGVADVDGTSSVARMLVNGVFYVSDGSPIVFATGDMIAIDVTYVF